MPRTIVSHIADPRLGLTGIALAAGGGFAWADPPPYGSQIESLGEVSYFNNRLGTVEVFQTNLATTLIEAAPDFEIATDQVYRRAPGETALFSFSIENTGNTDIEVAPSFGAVRGDFNFVQTRAVVDANSNGTIDASDPVLGDHVHVGYGSATRILVEVLMPASASPGQSSQGDLSARLSAADGFDQGAEPALERAATGTVIVDPTTLSLQKSVSAGAAIPGDTLVYTLRLRNNSTSLFDPQTEFYNSRVMIDGVADEALIVRDAIPLHTQFASIVDAVDFTVVYQTPQDTAESWSTEPPADLGDVSAVGFAISEPLPPGSSRDLLFSVQVHSSADDLSVTNQAEIFLPGPAGGFDPSLSNVVQTDIHGSSEGTLQFQSQPGTDENIDAVFEVDYGDEVWLRAASAQCNISPEIDRAVATLATDPDGDLESITLVETGSNTGVFVSPGVSVEPAPPVRLRDGRVQGSRSATLTAQLDCDGSAVSDLAIAPAGTIFDATTNEPLAGARVELISNAGDSLGSVMTGPDGVFELAPDTVGVARLRVTPPGGFSAPSMRTAFPGFDRSVDPSASYGQDFQIEVAGRTLRYDIPVDPSFAAALNLSKTSPRSQARSGDIVTYEIELRNTTPVAIQATEIEDTLPAGLSFLGGSARLDGVALGDPSYATRGTLVFDLGAIEPFAAHTLRYAVTVLPGTGDGERVNRAIARGVPVGYSDPVASNTASHTLRVDYSAGVFSEDGVILGKVFADCNGDGVQDNQAGQEPGVPGVKLITQEGLSVVTDPEGRFSLPGLSPRTHVLSLYVPSLPDGFRPIASRTLDTLSPGTRQVPLRAGEIRSEDFTVVATEGICPVSEVASLRGRIADFDQAALGVPQNGVLALEDNRRAGEGRVEATRTVRTANAVRLAEDLPEAPTVTRIPATLPLEPIIATAPSAPVFVDLEDGAILAQPRVSVRVAAPAGLELALELNGAPVPNELIGVRNGDALAQAVEYVALDLEPGENLFELIGRDPFGNVRGRESVTVTAPGPAAGLRLYAPKEARADPASPVPVIIQTVDADGRPAAAPLDVTLVAGEDTFDARDARPLQPGVQTLLTDGETRLNLIPADLVGTRRLRIDSPLGSAEAEIRFVADTDAAPIAVGLIEGAVDLGGTGTSALGGWLEADEISPFEDTEAGLEASLYMRGPIADNTVLTLRYDSDKDLEDDLFDSVEPDRSYPVLGDSSQRGFDARSRGKLFAKIERDASYILFGDVTYAAEAEAIQLGQMQRTLEGGRALIEADRLRLSLYAGETDTGGRVSEIVARGVSGPYVLDLAGIVRNSETIELLTRDRDQPGVILKTERLVRFTDYTLDYFTGTLLFTRPVPARDADFNPVSIRATFETVDGEGEAYFVGGGELGFDLTDWLEVGARHLNADAPVGSRDRQSVTTGYVDARVGEAGRLQLEAATSEDETDASGEAMRVSYEHVFESGRLGVRAARASEGFEAPGAAISAGREEVRVFGEHRIGEGRLTGELIYTGSTETSAERQGAVARYESAVTDRLRLRAGARYVSDRPDSGAENDAVTAIAGMNWSPKQIANLSLDIEGEADVRAGRGSRVGASIDYAHTPKWRSYAQALWSESRSGDFGFTDRADDVSVRAGTEYRWSEGISAFTEYRANEDFFDAGVAQGLTARWAFAPSFETRARIEHVQPISDLYPRNTAAGIGASWEPEDRRSLVEGDVEYGRAQSGGETWYVSSTVGRRWQDVTLLGRARVALSESGDSDRTRARGRLGWAHRPPTDDALNTLVWYEFDFEDADPGRETRHSWSIGGERKVGGETRFRGRLAGQFYSLLSPEFDLDADNVLLMAQAGVERDLSRRWMVGANLATFTDGDFESETIGVGAEIGFIPMRNTYVGVGYNHAELSQAQTERLYRQGWFLRLNVSLDDGLWEIF